MKLLIISHKWNLNRDKMSPVENFCYRLDGNFHEYNGQKISLSYFIGKSLIFFSNSRKSFKYSAPYNSHFAGQEFLGIYNIIKNKPDVVFFPYGDYNYNYTWILKYILNFKLVLYTFFSEDELKCRYKSLSHFRKADLLLVAGKGQYDYLKCHVATQKLVYFPLPIDTDFFTPSNNFQRYRIIQSGMNRRDFDSLFMALDILYARYKSLIVDFVGCGFLREKYANKPYAQFYDFISDEEMKCIYQNAHLQLLICLDGGSSNSLNEGLSCGLPIIATNLDNIVDYVNEENCILVNEKSIIEICDAVEKVFNNDELRYNMANASRKLALDYSVDVALKKFYKLIEQ
jgi:glycosyltransferase involved in cell wall biosynthesis